jgi:hypothetical protein
VLYFLYRPKCNLKIKYMGFVSDEEVKERLDSPRNLVNRPKLPNANHRSNNDTDSRQQERVKQDDDVAIAPLHNGGRRTGDKNIPEFMRALIGVSANLDTLDNVAENFGVSSHHAFELKHGMHSTAQGQNEKLVDKVNEGLQTPHELAVDRLTKSLLSITEEDISGVTKIKDKVAIASQLARVADATKPVIKEDEGSKGVQLLVYAPTIKQETVYETIPVQ